MEILFNPLLTEPGPVGHCLQVGGMQQKMGSMGGAQGLGPHSGWQKSEGRMLGAQGGGQAGRRLRTHTRVHPARVPSVPHLRVPGWWMEGGKGTRMWLVSMERLRFSEPRGNL